MGSLKPSVAALTGSVKRKGLSRGRAACPLWNETMSVAKSGVILRLCLIFLLLSLLSAAMYRAAV